MDLRQLNALIAVADHRSFSAAARALHTVQSNVSTHVARLERELNAILVDRTTGNLTDEGTAVVDRGRRVLDEIESISTDIAAMRDDIRGEVRTGVIGTTGRWLAPPLLDALEHHHPGVQIIVVDATTTSLLPLVITAELDHAIVNMPISDPETTVEPLFDEDCIVIAPSSHPLAAYDEIDLVDLAEHPLLLTPPGTTFRNAVDAEAAAVGVKLQVRAELDGMRLLASMAHQGFGPSLVPASASPSWDRGDFTRVRVNGLTPRRVGLVRRRRTTPSAATRAVRDVIFDVIRAEGPKLPGIHLRFDQ